MRRCGQDRGAGVTGFAAQRGQAVGDPAGVLSLGEISSCGEGFLEFFTKTIVLQEEAMVAGLLHDMGKLLLAWQLPDRYGQILARAREVQPHTVRIMLTGYSNVEAAIGAINEGGIWRYLTKPWDEEQLRERTHELYLRLKELEARDRLAQHMLSVPSLQETLDVLTQIAVEVFAMGRTVVYLVEEGQLVPAAAVGVPGAGCVRRPPGSGRVRAGAVAATRGARDSTTTT